MQFINNPIERELAIATILKVEKTTEEILSNVRNIVSSHKEVWFTDEEVREMEIIEAYHKEIIKYFPPKRLLRF